MGVDFYTCQNPDCGSTYPDCGDYFSCECGYSFCSNECGEREDSDDIEEDEEDEEREDSEQGVTCMFCREHDAPTENLFSALLTHYKITREDAIKLYYEQQKKAEEEDGKQ